MQISKPLKHVQNKFLQKVKSKYFFNLLGEKVFDLYDVINNFFLGIKFCRGHYRRHFHTSTDSASPIYQTVFLLLIILAKEALSIFFTKVPTIQ